jgi:hypothetical protein
VGRGFGKVSGCLNVVSRDWQIRSHVTSLDLSRKACTRGHHMPPFVLVFVASRQEGLSYLFRGVTYFAVCSGFSHQFILLFRFHGSVCTGAQSGNADQGKPTHNVFPCSPRRPASRDGSSRVNRGTRAPRIPQRCCISQAARPGRSVASVHRAIAGLPSRRRSERQVDVMVTSRACPYAAWRQLLRAGRRLLALATDRASSMAPVMTVQRRAVGARWPCLVESGLAALERPTRDYRTFVHLGGSTAWRPVPVMDERERRSRLPPVRFTWANPPEASLERRADAKRPARFGATD